MIGHQDIGVYLNAKALYASGDYFQELLSVRIVGEDSPSLIAAAGHMVPGTRILDAQGTGQEGMLLAKRNALKLKIKLCPPFPPSP